MPPLILGLLQNTAFLLAGAVVYDLWLSEPSSRRGPVSQVGTGAALGLLSIGLMVFAVEVEPGLIFDTRSVLLSVVGLFFGAVPTWVAAAIGATYRGWVGGPGMWTGILVLAASATVGLGWRRWRKTALHKATFGELLAFGTVVHILFLGTMLTLPGQRAAEVWSTIALPTFLLYPLGTAALGMILVDRLSRELTARRLAESEARHRSFFENNHAAMLIIEPDTGRIRDGNPAAAHFYGYGRDELRSMRVEQINTLPPDEIYAELARAKSEERSHFRFRHRLADDTCRDVEVFSGPVEVDDETLLYSIIHDVTDRVLAQNALREQARIFELQNAALEAAANPIVITDVDGTIEWVNPAFTELTGYSRQEAVGKNPRDLVKSGVEDSRFYEAMWSTILGGRVWRGELTNRKKDGSLYREQQTITPVRARGDQVSHFVAVKTDLSPRMEMEARLAQAQKLETVGRLAGGIAHDFNNILTVINGTMELTLSELPADVPMRDELEEVRLAGERGARLTRQLLAFSRRQVLAIETFDLNELIDELLRLLSRLLGEHVQMRVTASEEPAYLRGDRSQLEQVITNLALNARDAMPSGGDLTLSTEIVSLEAGHSALRDRRAPGRYVRIRVSDDGVGMTPELLDKIFEPFFTTKGEGQGTGLGLPTVYGIVKQSGGEIDVQSTPDEGTTFEIHLPLAPPPEQDILEPVAASPNVSRRGSILLVEDEPSILRLASRVLEKAGHDVVGVQSGDEAVRVAREHPEAFDLLFTDVVMPGMSGPELAKRVKELIPDINVLFASGYVEDVLRQHGVTSEGQQFVAKPYTLATLGSAVARALGR